MAFEILSERLQAVANNALKFCEQLYGNSGLKIEEGIDDKIGWRPTFFMKVGKSGLIAVEVDDNLYPASLRGAAYEISRYQVPISVYQACTLESYLKDPREKNINFLKAGGFGVITVDVDGRTERRIPCCPLAQHISNESFESAVANLTPHLKRAFRSAYETYLVNLTQGLQQAATVVEAIITEIAAQAVKKNNLAVQTTRATLAHRIDAMYTETHFSRYRGTLGAARTFVHDVRNPASHPSRTAKEAAEKIRKSRSGFLDAIKVADGLMTLAKTERYTIKIHT